MLSADMIASWTFDRSNVYPTADKPFGKLDPVRLANVTFDLGEFTTAIDDALGQIRSVTAAPGIAQVVDVFGSKLPLVDKTFGDLVLPSAVAQSIDAVKAINDF